MKKEEARTIAERLVSETDFKKCSAKFAEVRESERLGSALVLLNLCPCPNWRCQITPMKSQ
jgi:hypothetical protein